MEVETRARLEAHFAEPNRRLEEYLGTDMGWASTRSGRGGAVTAVEQPATRPSTSARSDLRMVARGGSLNFIGALANGLLPVRARGRRHAGA